MSASGFEFLDPGPLRDGELELALSQRMPASGSWSPAYRFLMKIQSPRIAVGRIDLRIGNTEHIVRYAGHIGYNVEPAYRGHHYAARAVRLLLPLARSHGLKSLWITCNPDNLASRRTCELAGAEFVEIVDLPPNTDMYVRGERQKCRYRIELE